jgi:hypothetical protein
MRSAPVFASTRTGSGISGGTAPEAALTARTTNIEIRNIAFSVAPGDAAMGKPDPSSNWLTRQRPEKRYCYG